MATQLKKGNTLEQEFFELDKYDNDKIEDFINHNLDKVYEPEVKSIKAITNTSLSKPLNEIGNLDKKNEIPRQLIELQTKINKLSPNNNKTFVGRIVSIFNKNKVMQNYLNKFKNGEELITNIVNKLSDGQKLLTNDNKELEVARTELIKTAKSLETKIKKMEELIQILKEKNIKDETIFELNIKLQDLMQLLAVAQNSIASIELLIKNNKELINGVNRTINVTTTALKVGVTIYVALQNQKNVLEAKKAVDETTSNLILENSKMLKEQGVEIQKAAYDATLDIAKLEESIRNVNQAAEDIKSFKITALPKVEENIMKMRELLSQKPQFLTKD